MRTGGIVLGVIAGIFLAVFPCQAGPETGGRFTSSLVNDYVDYIERVDEDGKRIADAIESLAKLRKDSDCPGGCDVFTPLLDQLDGLQDAAQLAQWLSRRAEKQRATVAELQIGIVANQRQARNYIAKISFYQEMAISVAEIAATVIVASATGDIQSVPREVLAKLTGSTASLGLNKTLNLIPGQYQNVLRNAGNATVKAAGRIPGERKLAASLERLAPLGIRPPGILMEERQQVFGRLVANLGRFSVLQVKGGEVLFKPGPRAAPKLAAIAELVARSAIHAVTATATAAVRKDLESVVHELGESQKFMRDMYLAASLAKKLSARLRQSTRKLSELRRHADALAVECQRTANSKRCGAVFRTALADLVAARDQVITPAQDRRDRAKQNLQAAHERWRQALIDAGTAHAQYRATGDHLAEAESLSKNKKRIATLAQFARDADKRAKYQAQLDKLNAMTAPGALQSEAAGWKQKRAAAWRRVEKAQADYDRAADAKHSVHVNTAPVILRAASDFDKARVGLQQTFDKCLHALAPTLARTGSIDPAANAKYDQQIYPQEIFSQLRSKQRDVLVALDTSIKSEIQRARNCTPNKPLQGQGRLSGCWSGGGRQWRLAQEANGALRAEWSIPRDAAAGLPAESRKFVGLVQGDFLDLGAAPARAEREKYVEFDAIVHLRWRAPIARTNERLEGMGCRVLLRRSGEIEDGAKFNRLNYGSHLRLNPEQFAISLRREMPVLERVESMAPGFRKTMPKVMQGGRIWIRALGNDGCDMIRDRIRVRIGANTFQSIYADLLETAPNSGEYRSDAAGVALPSYFLTQAPFRVAIEPLLGGDYNSAVGEFVVQPSDNAALPTPPKGGMGAAAPDLMPNIDALAMIAAASPLRPERFNSAAQAILSALDPHYASRTQLAERRIAGLKKALAEIKDGTDRRRLNKRLAGYQALRELYLQSRQTLSALGRPSGGDAAQWRPWFSALIQILARIEATEAASVPDLPTFGSAYCQAVWDGTALTGFDLFAGHETCVGDDFQEFHNALLGRAPGASRAGGNPLRRQPSASPGPVLPPTPSMPKISVPRN